MPPFQLVSPFQPTGDQPQAIDLLVEGLAKGYKHQVLLGATGTGKTFTVAKVVETVQRPTLILAHNKTLAAQLYAEFREFFPRNAVEYYVSYYDYYQPESYVPRYDLYIEKQTDINKQIENLRIAAKAALISRPDVLIVASVSCIYATGDPETWGSSIAQFRVGETVKREMALRQLVSLQYTRNDLILEKSTFRARGDTLEVYPPYLDYAFRIILFGDEIERITEFDPLTGEVLNNPPVAVVFPAAQFMADQDKLQKAIHDIEQELEGQIAFFKSQGKLVEAQRLDQRVRYDVEMLRETGFTAGIENYSRHLDQRLPGSPPYSLIDYFPKDYLLVIDESHMTIPQLHGMYNGDRTRKTTLVEYGFRLPSALDNRPLKFDEIEERMGQTIYTSATPGPYEMQRAHAVVQQIIRPTGVLDPQISVRPVEGQVEDLLQEVALRVKKGQRAIITTLTQKMAEELAGYLNEVGVRAHYLHAEIETLERVEILRDLRMGVYDAVVGINLLREGIDLPEVSLVCILDADKEGFLRSEQALVQIIGRAARHIEGQVILYANKMTAAMKGAIDETERRRAIQQAYNQQHGITPASIVKEIRDLTDRIRAQVAEEDSKKLAAGEIDVADLPKEDLHKMIKALEKEMKEAAKSLEFEKAAALRDQLFELRGLLAEKDPDALLG
ncbi:MAG: excinuclease ABC subunit UvrB [Chloroflexi bacterium]|nr:excinuclease ABC subunit UvrB [Chloroflexota bacterium]